MNFIKLFVLLSENKDQYVDKIKIIICMKWCIRRKKLIKLEMKIL